MHHVIQGDALDIMRTGSFDAIVSDPPYCSGGFTEADRRGAKSQGCKNEDQYGGWFLGDNMGTAGLQFLLRSVAAEGVRLRLRDRARAPFCRGRQPWRTW